MIPHFIRGVRPCVLDTTGARYRGASHWQCIASIPAGRTLDVTVGDCGHCFETPSGRLLDRFEAARLTGLRCHVQPGQLHSEDLRWQGADSCENRPHPYVRETGGWRTPDGRLLTAEQVAFTEQELARHRRLTLVAA